MQVFNKLNRWQNQAIIQLKYIDLKRPTGAKRKKTKKYMLEPFNNGLETLTGHSDETKSSETRKYWFAMKGIIVVAILR